MRARSMLPALAAAAAGSFVAAPSAHALRPLFEPTDLELQDAGEVELDFQFGGVRSQGPWRIVVPDFEFDVGITNNIELDLDGAYAVEGPSSGPFAFDHSQPDSLWLAAKLGIADWGDDDARPAWGIGMGAQVGPKLPTAAGAHGLGVEGLALLGGKLGYTHLVFNGGMFVDPAPDAGSARRPIGVEIGLDLDQDLLADNRMSITGELSSVMFLSDDPNQLLATAGLAFEPKKGLEFSIIGLWGFLAGSDRYGVLVGFSPTFSLWNRDKKK